MKMQISRSRKGLPVMGVGGGSMRNTVTGRYLLRNGELPPALFVRSHGDLSNRDDQAGVVVQVDDIVCVAEGSRDTWVAVAYQVVEILPDEVEVVAAGTLPYNCYPQPVVDGLSVYHNRDGRYFVAN